jgi:hypothetical protein
VRDLAKTEVVKSAAIGALAVGLACYPRLALWPSRGYPVWYLEAVLLLGGFVLWAFVFAWHAKYAGQPVLTLRLPSKPCIVATVAGIFMALTLNEFVDPLFRASTPEDYPANLPQWIATTLFSLGFAQLFLVFAPFDWSIRLTQRRWFAMLFTILFGIFVLVVKTHSSAVPVEPALFWLLVVVRAATSFLSVWLYSRYGLMLVWWWCFLLQTRHLLGLAGAS